MLTQGPNEGAKMAKTTKKQVHQEKYNQARLQVPSGKQ
jgi:hypothetical protein